MRISEPVLTRLDDLVQDHDVPHLWVRKNSLSDRKTQASIRCVPLLGVSLEASQALHCLAAAKKRLTDTTIRVRDWQHLARCQTQQIHAAPGL